MDWARSGRQATIDYIVQWLNCARQHGLTIDYLAGNQNERSYVKSVDGEPARSARLGWVLGHADRDGRRRRHCGQLADRQRLGRRSGVQCRHSRRGRARSVRLSRRTATNASSTRHRAQGLGKPLWASELGAIDGATGAANMARAEIRGYPNAALTGFITWPMIDAIPPGVPHENRGLIYADQPWSGYYQVNAMTYAIAMMSWFTAPGWHFIDGADGGFGGLTGASVYSNGSYATLEGPERHATGAPWPRRPRQPLSSTPTSPSVVGCPRARSTFGARSRARPTRRIGWSSVRHPPGRWQVLLRPVARLSVLVHHDQRGPARAPRKPAGSGHARLLQPTIPPRTLWTRRRFTWLRWTAPSSTRPAPPTPPRRVRSRWRRSRRSTGLRTQAFPSP